MQLPFGVNITFGNGNSKYVKKTDCENTHKLFSECLNRKLSELSIDRNQKLLELKSDLTEHFDMRIQMLRDLIKK